MSPEPGIDLWWKDLRDEAIKFDLAEFLPLEYWDMRDIGATGPSGLNLLVSEYLQQEV